MQRGVADCAITGTSAGNTARWWEVSDRLYTLPMGWSMIFLAANHETWQKLDPKVRDFLEKEFAEFETGNGLRPRRTSRTVSTATRASDRARTASPPIRR